MTDDGTWFVFQDEVQICRELYLKDIEERRRLWGDNVLDILVNILASVVGFLTNPTKLANTFSNKTIGVFIGYLLDAILLI